MIRTVALFLCAACLFGADQSCRWLDAATAGGFLGGDVTSKVTSTACEFTRGRNKLRIEVRKLANAHEQFVSFRSHCKLNALPLRAIGNEALLCPKSHEVVGRVRNEFFKVRLTVAEDPWRSKAEAIAEQIAGALF